MTNLKTNIDHYMRIKGIQMYSKLLVDIAHQLGIYGSDAYDFAKRERANFSKMLKGERPLKYEFIIPLETIFGVSLARLLNEDAYKLPPEKDNIPFDKGFRYYACVDDLNLYRNEFNLLLAKDGKSILNNMDEFGKTFLDYVAEYHSTNAIKYLHDEFGMNTSWNNHFDFKKEKGNIWVNYESGPELARVVASIDDPTLFNDIYDSYKMFFQAGFYSGPTDLFNNGEYLEILLENEKIFDSLFEIRKYEFALLNAERIKSGKEKMVVYSANPIINNCLNYALKNLDRYKNQALKMLKFGIEHNRELLKKYNYDECYVCNEYGNLQSIKNEFIHEFAIIINVKDIRDEKINMLINEMPKFKDFRRF